MDTKHLNFKHMISNSHSPQNFNRYIRIICSIFDVEYINALELSEEKTPYDIQINGKTNIEVKVQKKFVLEQYTDDDNKKRGWVHTLLEDDVDYVLFLFPTENLYLCLDAIKLYDWWIDNCDNYKIIRNEPSKNNNNIWVSSYSYVNILDIPKILIYNTNIDMVVGLDDWF